jgi:hypothetical protein
MTLPIPPLDGLSWARIRAKAREVVTGEPTAEVVAIARAEIESSDHRRRMLAAYLLGYTAASHPENLALLRERIVPDPSWEVQEVLAQAFDAYCAGVGYERALATIDAWLADDHPNARRAVSEGLRPWTSKSRAYFAGQPAEAIRRLAALRADPSEYVRHSVGNALRDVRRSHPDLVDSEIATWDRSDPAIAFTFARVEKAR